MAFTLAGQYGPEQLIDALGRPLPNVSVAVYVKGTSTPIPLYTDRTKGTSAPNPVVSSTLGNLTFWADPGQCDIVANGTRLTVDVPLDPLEPNATFVPSATPFPLSMVQPGTGAAPTALTPWSVSAPAGDTTGFGGGPHGPFQCLIGGASFNGTFDRVMYFGYNGSDTGGVVVATEPKFSFEIESDYNNGTHHLFESYFEYHKGGAVTVADGVTNGTATVTSATAAFNTQRHVGMSISGTNIPANSYIGVVNSATSIGLSSSPTANTPVSATGSGSGVTLTIGPSGPTQYRPFSMQIDRASGVLTDISFQTPAINFETADGNQTVWATLTPTGLSVSSPSGTATSTSFVLASASGQDANIELDVPGRPQFLLQPDHFAAKWDFLIGGVQALQLFSTGDLSSPGQIRAKYGTAGAGGFYIDPASGNQSFRAAIINDGSDGLQVGQASGWTGITFLAGGTAALTLGPTPSLGFYGHAAAAKQTVTGSKGANAALTSLMTALTAMGLVTDTTT